MVGVSNVTYKYGLICAGYIQLPRIRGACKDRAQPLPKRHFSQLAASERELSAYGEDDGVRRTNRYPRLVSLLPTWITAGLARRIGVEFLIPKFAARELADRDRFQTRKMRKRQG
jgi:hypothetical protein